MQTSPVRVYCNVCNVCNVCNLCNVCNVCNLCFVLCICWWKANFHKSKFNAPFCLVGDFNARTGLLADYLDNDDNFVSDLLGLNSCDDSSLCRTTFRIKQRKS